jgi:hypothetical protein
VIPKEAITSFQRDMIINYRDECEALGFENYGGWDIVESKYDICGRTGMDNFNMYGYLQRIGIDNDVIRWM